MTREECFSTRKEKKNRKTRKQQTTGTKTASFEEVLAVLEARINELEQEGEEYARFQVLCFLSFFFLLAEK